MAGILKGFVLIGGESWAECRKLKGNFTGVFFWMVEKKGKFIAGRIIGAGEIFKCVTSGEGGLAANIRKPSGATFPLLRHLLLNFARFPLQFLT